MARRRRLATAGGVLMGSSGLGRRETGCALSLGCSFEVGRSLEVAAFSASRLRASSIFARNSSPSARSRLAASRRTSVRRLGGKCVTKAPRSRICRCLSSSTRRSVSSSAASASSQARRNSARARSLSVSHSASAARACTRERSTGSRKVRASSAKVLTSEMAVVRRISAIGSTSAVGFFAEVLAGLACGGCARTPAGCAAKQIAATNRRTRFIITLLQHGMTSAEIDSLNHRFISSMKK